MERRFHILLFSGFCLFAQSKYVLIQEQKTWYDAQVYCRENYIDLATVQSNEDRTELEAVKPALTSVAWIGLHNDINSWRWSYKDENMTLKMWRTNEPNNYNTKEECGEINKGLSNDVSCHSPKPYFCFNEGEKGTNRFIYINTSKSWHEAQSYCRQHHTDLATIRSQNEIDQLMQMNMGSTWIGLFRDSWMWSDKTNLSTPIAWRTGQPDITGSNSPCGVVGPDGLIDDLLCSNLLPFICINYSKKQILRVEVKSGQNLNDPAMMENILQRVKQKLMHHGIEKNTRLIWRLQPDGNVFSPKHDYKDRNGVKDRNLNDNGCSDLFF